MCIPFVGIGGEYSVCIDWLKRVHLFGWVRKHRDVTGMLLACTHVYPCCAQPKFRYLTGNEFSGSIDALGKLAKLTYL